MAENKPTSRRQFLRSLGIGSASVFGLMAAEPFKAFASKETPRPMMQMEDNKMTYRVNSHSGDKVSLLGYGMMRLPQKDGRIDQDEVNKEVDYALAHGLNYFDTAPVYHGGQSEVAMGIALKRHPRESFYVATKLSNFDKNHWDLETAQNMFHRSLELLQVDYIDYYLLHSVGGSGHEEFIQRFVDNGVFAWLKEQKAAGKIRNLGFSFHGAVDTFDYLIDNNDEFDWDFCQIQMNYIDWRHADTKHGNTDAEYLYGKLEKAGIQAVLMEPLRGGRLAKLSDEDKAPLEALRPGDTAARWAFRWTAKPNVLTVLSGMTTMAVLEENIETFSPLVPCSDKENELMEKVANAMSGVPVIPCTDCKYCMPCPAGVDIPGNFAIYNKAVNEKILPLPEKTDADYKKRVAQVAKMYKKGLKKNQWATKCVDCEACLPKCPQHIRISNQMGRIIEILQKR